MDTEKEIQAESCPDIICPKCGYMMISDWTGGFVKCKTHSCSLYDIRYRMELPSVKLVKVE